MFKKLLNNIKNPKEQEKQSARGGHAPESHSRHQEEFPEKVILSLYLIPIIIPFIFCSTV